VPRTALGYLLTTYGPAIAAGLVYAGDQIASGFDKLGSAFASGHNYAVATLEEAGYGAVQLGTVLDNVFELGETDTLGELVKLGYDAEGVATALNDANVGIDIVTEAIEYGLNQIDSVVAGALAYIGYGVTRVAQELKNWFGDSATQVVGVLKNTYGNVAGEIASALESVYNETTSEVENALQSFFNAGTIQAIGGAFASFGSELESAGTTVEHYLNPLNW
jgi:hypothetical protein